MAAPDFFSSVVKGYPFFVTIKTDSNNKVACATVKIADQDPINLRKYTKTPTTLLGQLAILATKAIDNEEEMTAKLRMDFITRMKAPGTIVMPELMNDRVYTYLVQGTNKTFLAVHGFWETAEPATYGPFCADCRTTSCGSLDS